MNQFRAQEIIVRLVTRPNGATKAELMRATGWQWHSIRGLVSAVMRKEMGLYIPRYHGRYQVRSWWRRIFYD
jgi:hypothetical protein